MKKTIVLIACVFMASCVTNTVKNNDNGKTPEVKTGWSDDNTYTVMVTASDRHSAIDRAHHEILKDIVDVRVRNQSPYTDITKISKEFEGPLKNGRIIKSREVPGGIEIYYQIMDEGLKMKFKRK